VTGKLIRPEVQPKSPRPGRLAKGAEIWAQMDATEFSEGIAEPTPYPDMDNTSNEVAKPSTGGTESVAGPDMDAVPEPPTALSEDAVEPEPAAVDELAKAIIRSFSVPGRGYEGNRNLCPNEDQLREWLQADGVSFDDGLLSAALTRLETAMVPGYNVRLVRGTELHRRNRSIWVPAERWPDRAMLLDPLSPWHSATYEPCDIVPYLIPAGRVTHEAKSLAQRTQLMKLPDRAHTSTKLRVIGQSSYAVARVDSYARPPGHLKCAICGRPVERRQWQAGRPHRRHSRHRLRTARRARDDLEHECGRRQRNQDRECAVGRRDGKVACGVSAAATPGSVCQVDRGRDHDLRRGNGSSERRRQCRCVQRREEQYLGKASDLLNVFRKSNVPVVEFMASPYVESCLTKLLKNHESTLDSIGTSMLIGLPREDKKRAEKEYIGLFNRRENYLNGLYTAAKMDMGAAQQGDNPCP
jgi:hypothetical protein